MTGNTVRIAYNGCHGGFRLSYDAVKAYAKRKGFEIYCGYQPDIAAKGFDCPYVECPREKTEGFGFYSWFKSPDFNWGSHFSDRDIPRDDPDLIAVIEELGDDANSVVSSLKIAEVPMGSQYRIDEYDGLEAVMTPADYEWKIAGEAA